MIREVRYDRLFPHAGSTRLLADWLFVFFCRQERTPKTNKLKFCPAQTRERDTTLTVAERPGPSGESASASVAPLILLKKTNSKSNIWNHFGLKKGTDGKAVDDGHPPGRCCHQPIEVKGGNTSNLIKRLQCRHPDLYVECQVNMPCLFTN